MNKNESKKELENKEENLEIEELEDDEEDLEIEELEDNEEELNTEKLEEELKGKQYKCILKTNNVIELLTISSKCIELFLTQKEKIKNIIYYIIFVINTIISFFASMYLYYIIFGNQYEKNIALALIISLIIFLIILPILNLPFINLLTEIKYIKLRFTSKGLKLTSSRKTKNSIFIKSKNIKNIYFKKHMYPKGKTCEIGIKLILQLHRPIISIHNHKKFSKFVLIEKLPNYSNELTEIKALITDINNILKVKK